MILDQLLCLPFDPGISAMSRIAYYRVSTAEQSIEAQRHALGGAFDKEFIDEGVSGTVHAEERLGFSELMTYVREGDSLHVYAVDRMGRDAIDIQTTVKKLREKGIEVFIHGLGMIAEGVGDLILAVLSQVADMERKRILERTAAGREVAKHLLKETGRTQHGKTSMGRPMKANPDEVKAWRKATSASISKTASHFGLSEATVKRCCRSE